MRGLSILCVLFGARSLSSDAQTLQPGNTCKILAFIPFTDRRDPPPKDPSKPESNIYGYGTWPDPMSQAKAAFSMMAAAELARHHFNLRDTTIVPELGQLGQCNITMPDPEDYEVTYINTGYDKVSTLRTFHDTRYILSRKNGGGNTSGSGNTSGGGNNSGGSGNNGGGVVGTLINGRPTENTTGLPISDKDFCSFIGPVHPYVVDGITQFAEAGRIPLIAYETISSKFSSQREYPFFASTIPNANDFGEVISKAFRDIWTREGVGIIYDKDEYADFGEVLESPIRDIIENFDHEAIFSHTYQFDEETIAASLTQVKKKGYRTIIVLNDRPGSIERIAHVADSMNMIGTGYFWLLMGGAFRPSLVRTMKHAVGSPMDKLLSGAALFTNYDRPFYLYDDPFLAAWKSQDVISIDKLNRMQPLKPDSTPYYIASDSYFQDEIPSEYASYIYDAVMLAGISACNDFKVTRGLGNFTHIVELRKTEFTGASGKIRFRPKKNIVFDDPTKKSINNLLSNFKNDSSRDPQDTFYGIYNLRRGKVEENNMQSYEQVLTHLYSHDNLSDEGVQVHGAWTPVADTSFLFFDGTSNEPLPRRDVFDANYLSQGIQSAGLVLACIALIIAVGTAVFVFLNKENKLIKAGQPEFLYMLCFGAALVAPSSIFVTFDESDGFSTSQLDGMCSAFPWFFIVGYLLMYCALISKLWRLSKLMQMRRKAVHAKQVLFPILVIMGCCFALLVVWQIIDPVRWHRTGISEKGLPYETYGECTSIKYGKTPFVVPIIVLMSAAVAATAVFSFKLRHVQSELSESSWIFAGIFLHIQTWMVGVPVLYITHGISRDAYYLMIVILTFTFATSLVGFVIGPKMYEIITDKYFGESKKKTSISIVGGTSRISGLTSPNMGQSTSTFSLQAPVTTSSTDGSNQVAQLENEHLKSKVTELTMEMESLNVYIAELERANYNTTLMEACTARPEQSQYESEIST